MSLISLSTMKPVQNVNPAWLVVGAKVRYSGDMANPSGSGCITAVYPDTCGWGPSCDVILTDGRKSRVESFSFAREIGQRYHLEDGIAPAEFVATLISMNAIFEAKARADKTQADNSFAAECERIKAENPKLTVGGGCVIAAKNMRAMLKAAWPKVKFSVRSESFSGGNAVRVSWTDGPATKDVDAIANRFSPGWFDGMTDSYQYKTSPWSDTFGSAKYISTSRNYSLAMIERSIASLVAEYGDKNAVTAEQYNNGDGYNTSPIEGSGYGAYSWQSLINLALSEMEG